MLFQKQKDSERFGKWLKDRAVPSIFFSDKGKRRIKKVFMDRTKVPIDTPSLLIAQENTYSSYKNDNSVKVVIGKIPRGFTSFVSSVYRGYTSDRPDEFFLELLIDITFYFVYKPSNVHFSFVTLEISNDIQKNQVSIILKFFVTEDI